MFKYLVQAAWERIEYEIVQKWLFVVPYALLKPWKSDTKPG